MNQEKTLLLVEDEMIISMKQARDLETEGYRVIQVSSGIEAIEKVEALKGGIDLILMDIDLGRGMDGTEAAQEILKKYEIPVVFLSSHTEKAVVDKTEKITSYGYVVKNAGITVLSASIRMAFRLFEAHRHISQKRGEIEAMNEELNATIEEQEATNEELISSQKDLLSSEVLLKKSEEKFAKAFKASPAAISINSLEDGTYFDVNDAFLKKIGFRREEVIGRRSRDLKVWHQESDRERFIQKLISSGHLNDYEISFRMKTGAVRDYLISSEIIELNEKKYSLNYYHDITEHKEAEEAIRKSEETYRLLAENSTDMISRHTPDGVYLYASPACRSLLGYEPEELEGRPAFDFIHPEDRDIVDESRSRVSQRPLVDTVTYRMKKKNGTYIWLEGISRSIADGATGKVSEIQVSSRDVTDRVESGVELSRSRDLLQNVINSAPFGAHTYMLDDDGRLIFISANRSADEILGVDHRQFIGKTIEEAFPSLAGTAVPASYRRVADTGEPYREEQVTYNEQGISGAFEVHGIRTGRNIMTAFFRDITEKKKADEALTESEKRYRFLVENMTDVIWQITPEYRFTYSSPADEKMRGYRNDEVIGRTIFEFMTPESSEHIKKAGAERLERGKRGEKLETAEYIFQQVCKDGHIIWTEVISHPIYGRDGILTGFQGITRDFTRRKLAEDALRESEQKYSSILNGAAEGILIADIEIRKFTYANPAICTMLGYSAEELIGMSLRDIHPEESLPLVVSYFEAQARGDIRVAPSLPCLRKDGAVFYADICTSMIVINGVPSNVGFFTDVSESKKAKDELEQNRSLLKSFVEHTPAAVAMLDRDLRYVAASNRWLQDYRLGNPLSIIGRHHYEVFPGLLSMKNMQALLERALAGSVERRDEERFTGKDGSELWLRWEVRPWLDANGNIGGIMMMTENITESKRIQAALRDRQTFIEGLFESLQDGLTVFTPDRKRLMVNNALIKMTGFSRDELLQGLPPYSIWPPEHKESIAPVFESLMKGELKEKEIVLKRKNGERFPVILTPSYMKDEFGMIVYYIVTIKDITERHLINEELRKSLQEKEILMIELHHRVKNSLIIIQSLLSMEMDNLGDDNSRNVFQSTIARIQSMCTIYEQLYSSFSLDRIDLKQYILDITRQLITTYAADPSMINLTTDMEEITIDLKRSVTVGLILNELITNTIKYAYPDEEGGEIHVTLKKIDTMIRIVISDYGRGMEEFNRQKKSKGIGMHLVGILTKQIEGEFSMTGDRGVSAQISFPL